MNFGKHREGSIPDSIPTQDLYDDRKSYFEQVETLTSKFHKVKTILELEKEAFETLRDMLASQSDRLRVDAAKFILKYGQTARDKDFEHEINKLKDKFEGLEETLQQREDECQNN